METKDEISKKVAEMLLEIKAVMLSPHKPFKYASGIISPIYTDCRLLISHPPERTKITQYFVNCIMQEVGRVDVVAGTASAGIAPAALLADSLNMPMVYVRKASKNHGTQKHIEGVLEKGQRVILVEDLISTGGSALAAIGAIRKHGGVVNDCLCVFTYQMQASLEGFEKAEVKLHNLTDLETLLKVAVDSDYIKKPDIPRIEAWAKSPKDWGKRRSK